MHQLGAQALPGPDAAGTAHGPDRLDRPTDDSSRLFRLGYRPALDGLRGLAVLAVMAFHEALPLASGGFVGVDIFFVLSGFLITTLILEERVRTGTVNLRNFYVRRGLRLFPALFAVLATWCVYSLIVRPERLARTVKTLGAVVLYVGNWVIAFRIASLDEMGHTWSLAVEEQFYMLWPIAILLVLSSQLSRVAVLWLLSLLIACTCAHRALLWEHAGSYSRVYYAFDTRADSLLVGCLVGLTAVWSMWPVRGWFLPTLNVASKVSAVLLAAVIASVDVTDAWLYDRGGLTLISFAVAAILVKQLVAPTAWTRLVLESSLLVWLGRLSYGLYLWHGLIAEAVQAQSQNLLRTQALGLSLGLTVICAAASYYVIERPFLRLKDRFTNGRGMRPATGDTFPRGRRFHLRQDQPA